MGGAEEEWVKAAMTDDTMVVELLVQLHGAAPSPSPPRPALPLEWTVRQRRSRPVTVNAKKLGQRASPSTPLSWSGAASLSGGSGGAGGSEESSRLHIENLPAATRSKLNGDSDKAGSKRSRKKKTLPQLKDEENSLLKERKELKREIAALRLNLERQKAKNEKLKRIKVDFQPLPNRAATSAMEESVSDRLQPETTAPIISGNAPLPSIPPVSNTASFVLPDLNMPFEDASPDMICSVS